MKRFRPADYVSISVYWFALSYLLMDLFNARQPGLGYTALYSAAGLAYLLGALVLMAIREKRVQT